MVATTLAAFVQVGVKTWIFKSIQDICDPNQSSQLTCPHNQVFFTASAVWSVLSSFFSFLAFHFFSSSYRGLIGPSRQFGSGSIYHPQLYAIIVGAFLPLPFWFLQRKYPHSWIKWVSTPVILNGVSNIPPATGINYSSWFAVGFVFQYWIRKKNFAWWSKFNYVASSALDSGELLSLRVCDCWTFFARYRSVVDFYIFDVASAKRGDQFGMVGEYGSYEEYAVLFLD